MYINNDDNCSNLIVIRINKQKEIMNSRPCSNCLTMMQSAGIRKVSYTKQT